MNVHVTKYSGNVELFNLSKFNKSITLTLATCGYSSKQQHEFIKELESSLHDWLKNKHEVSSLDIFSFAEKYLYKHNKKAAVVYKKYKDIW